MLPSRFRLKLPPSWNRNYPDFKTSTALFKLIGKRVADQKGTRVGFIVSTKVGKATVRNRTRRKIEALLLDHLEKSRGQLEVIIIVYPTCAKSSHEELSSSLNQALSKIHFS